MMPYVHTVDARKYVRRKNRDSMETGEPVKAFFIITVYVKNVASTLYAVLNGQYRSAQRSIINILVVKGRIQLSNCF